MPTSVRNPKQTRSIETKNKIIKASYELFAEVGYYNTNTAEIAKKANVSTGIVYGYFRNKSDILFEILDLYMADVYAPIISMLNDFTQTLSISNLAYKAIDMAIETHKKYANIHEALHSMRHSDEKVNQRFIELEDDITVTIAQRLVDMGIDIPNIMERVHLAMDVIQSFAHEYIYDRHRYIDYDCMRTLVHETLVSYLSK